MSRNTQSAKGLTWNEVPEATGYNIHMDTTDDPQFLAKVDAGDWPPVDSVTAPPYLFNDQTPDNADWAVVAFDDQGRFSDPHSPSGWQDVPLLNVPLDAPTGGTVLYGD